MDYRKVRSSRHGFISSSRLYLGKDHLLAIEANLFAEKYYRFYFSDIQALVVRRTDRGAIWSIILAFASLLMTTCSIGSIPPGQWTPTPGYFTLALIAIVLTVVNISKGPSCTTHIQTSVTVQKIGALHRLKKTQGILPDLRSHIRRNQGSLTREQIVRNTVMPEEEIFTVEDHAASSRIQEHEPAVKNPARYHKFAFGMVLLNAGLDSLWFFVHGLAVYVTGAIGGMASFGGIITALVVQTRKNTSAAVRRITWAVFVSYLILFAFSYSASVYYMIQSGIGRLSENNRFDPFSFYNEFVDKGPMDKPGFAVITIVSIVISVLLGVGGLVAVGLKRPGSTLENRKD